MLGAGDEYSRGLARGQNEFWIVHRATEQLRSAADPASAVRSVLEALTGEEGLGFPNALWLAVDELGALLRAEAAAGETGGEIEAETLRRLCLPLRDAAAHPVVRSLEDGRTRRLFADAGDDAFSPVLEACLGPGPYLALPAISGATRGLLLLDVGSASDADESRGAAAEALAKELAYTLDGLAARAGRDRQSARLQGLGEIARSILNATNLPDVLAWTVRGALRLADGERGLLWTFDECNGILKLGAQAPARSDDALNAVMPEVMRRAEACLRQACSTICTDLRLAEGADTPAFPSPLPAAFQPLTAFGDRVGVMAIVGRPASAPPRFGPEAEGLLIALGGYAAIAIRNAQLAEAMRGSERRMREMHAEAARLEKLANLGEMTTRLAHDLRNPAAAIRGFARRIERGLPKEDARRELASLVAREARRIEGMLVDPLEFARESRPRLALRQLNRVVQDAVADRRDEIQTQGVVLEEAYAEPMPDLLLDTERVRLALVNILRSVLAAAHRNDALRIETLVQGDRVLLEVAGSGERARGESIDRLFAPFGGATGGNPGLGLAVAQQIVDEHGWEISVRAEGEWGVIFTVSIPLQENRDRRNRRDRRAGRDRRRGEAGPMPPERHGGEEQAE
jgi:signal transduction histidine kinase